MICYLVPAAEDYRIRHYLEMSDRSSVESFRILHWEDLGRQELFDRCTYVFSALDRPGPGMERLLSELDARLRPLEGVRILNHTGETLRRFDLLTELRRQGWNDFRAVRAAGDLAGLKYPVFLREDRSHEGSISGLLETPGDVESAIGRAVLQGYAIRNLLVVELCQTADENGVYRKYSSFIVGDRIVARSVNSGRHWMLKHGGNEYSIPMLLEEREYVFNNPHLPELEKIFKLARCEYGRIDYSFRNGRMQTWEINLNPAIGRRTGLTVLKLTEEQRAIRDETKRRFYARFLEAWASVDPPPSGEAVSIALDPRTIRAAAPWKAKRSRPLAALRALLRPAKRMLDPRARPVYRLVAKLARRVEG